MLALAPAHLRALRKRLLTAMVQGGAICTMSTPPTPPIRLTIPVSAEVHQAFSRMAEVSGVSIGRCMGDWLADTLEGVEFITDKLQRAREAPKMVVREMRQQLLGVADELQAVSAAMRSAPVRDAGDAPRGRATAARAGVPPRRVIRGGKSPSTGAEKRASRGEKP